MVSRWPELAATTMGASRPTPCAWSAGLTAIVGGAATAGAPATWTAMPPTGPWVPGRLHDVNTTPTKATLPTNRPLRPSLGRSAIQFHRTIVRSQGVSDD